MQELQAISTNTPVKNKILTVVAEVPYRLPGNVIRHFTIEFKVLKKANHYVAFPICDDAKCRLTHLPHNLIFSIKDGLVVTAFHEHQDLVEDIMQKVGIIR